MAYTTINKSTDYFNTVLYTGNNSSPRTITGVGFQPDMNWSKIRSESNDHWVSDAVRGANKIVRPNTTDDELLNGSSGYLSSFNSDGYVIAAGSGTNNNFNKNSGTMVSWNWKANGAGSTNNDGNRTSTVSASTTAGFSIVRYQGNSSNNQTIGHGLGVAPKMIFIKNLSSSLDWIVYNKTITASKHLHLNTTAAEATDAGMFNNTEPTSSVFTVHANNDVNKANDYFIAYCFAEKTGYSKFGKYIGNGNADGPFIYTGFKPAWVMFKRSDNTGSWYIKDNKRSGTSALQNFGQMNPNQTQYPSADTSFVENKTSGYAMDILSNGFKPRGTDSGINASGGTYIYMAFAEAPLVGSNGVIAKAR